MRRRGIKRNEVVSDIKAEFDILLATEKEKSEALRKENAKFETCRTC